MTASMDEGGELRENVVRGLGWKLFSQIAQQGATAVVALILARLLTPHEFGLAAMALAFMGIATLFTDFALGAALVQRPVITDADRSTVFWTTLAAGAVVTAVGVALAPTVAALLSTPDVKPLVAAASAGALLSAVGMTQSALLTRNMEFRSLELRAITASLAAGAFALTLAIAGAGAWAIVGQSLGYAAVSSALVWRLTNWRPALTFSFASLRSLGPFGAKVFLARFLAYVNLNADKVLIGRYLGSSELGAYAVAYNVMFLPLARIAQPVQHVLFAALSKLQNDPKRLGQAWLRGNNVIAAVTAPAFLGMAVVAPDFVPVVLGDRWNDAIPVLQLLSIAGVAQSLTSLNWSAMQAVGSPGALLRFVVLSSVLTVAAFVVGLEWGITGVAGMFAGARLVVAVSFAWVVCREVGLRLVDWVEAQRITIAISVTMAGAVLVARQGLLETGIPQGVRLVLLILLGVAVYAGLVRWRASGLVDEARLILRRRA